jgi:hypothetical protein
LLRQSLYPNRHSVGRCDQRQTDRNVRRGWRMGPAQRAVVVGRHRATAEAGSAGSHRKGDISTSVSMAQAAALVVQNSNGASIT